MLPCRCHVPIPRRRVEWYTRSAMYTVSRGQVLGEPTHTCSTDVYLHLHQRLSFRCITASPSPLGSRPIIYGINHQQTPGSIGGRKSNAQDSSFDHLPIQMSRVGSLCRAKSVTHEASHRRTSQKNNDRLHDMPSSDIISADRIVDGTHLGMNTLEWHHLKP